MVFLNVLLAILLVSVVVGDEFQRNSSDCLRRFKTDRAHFERCKKNVCFLFLHEKPFVQIDPKMKKEKAKLFRCNNPLKAYAKLDGIAFDIHQKMILPNDPWCIWAGDECRFNNMVDFVLATAKSNETSDYQFAISGFLTILPRRITEYTTPTIPWLESQVVVLGPKRDPIANRVIRAFQEALHPFHPATWMLLTFITVLFIALAFVNAIVFSTPSSFMNILSNFFGDRSQDHRYDTSYIFKTKQSEEHLGKLRLLHRATLAVLGIACSTFVIIVILFYEISVVNFLFAQKDPKLGKNITGLTAKELGMYAVAKGTAEETMWRRAVDPTGTRFPTDKSLPWVRCHGSDECYERVLNKSDPVKFMITFAAEASYQLKARQACDYIALYDTRTPHFSFSGGWYVGSSVSIATKVRLDKEIVRLKQEDRMRQIIESKVTPINKVCSSKNRNIGPDVIAIPLIFIVGPCIVAIASLLGYGCTIRYRMTNLSEEKILA